MATRKNNDSFYDSLKKLLEISAAAKPHNTTKNARPGRPTKITAPVQPVLLHLYRDQVSWLDGYSEFLADMTEGNSRLSRVEIVRALLLALAEYALKHQMSFPEGCTIHSEDDLRRAVVQALENA